MNICEVCDEKLSGPTLDLGFIPLCDDLLGLDKSSDVPRYHQEIQLCTRCLTAHQLHPVEKKTLFKPSYHYRSSLTKDVIDGMKSLLSSASEISTFSENSIILDVGCNDGSLLGLFKEQFGCKTIGIDPTDAINENGKKIDVSIQSFFDQDSCRYIYDNFGPPNLITFTNVFAHIEDFSSLCKNLRILIGQDTILVIENHYLGSILNENQFDTFYHEHPRTYSETSFVFVAQKLGMKIVKVQYPKRYGGNIRVFLAPQSSVVAEAQTEVTENWQIDAFARLQSHYLEWKLHSEVEFRKLVKRFGKVYGKSLPGRAVTLINALGIDSDQMPAIFEQEFSPKIGFGVPGTHIPILKDREILTYSPECILVWAWHIVDEVVSQLDEIGYRGEVWVPLPVFKRVR